MLIRTTWLVLMLLSTVGNAGASDLKDPSQTPISQTELTRLITTTPLNLPVHSGLIARAYASGLAEVALNLYSLLAKKEPNNGYASLRQGTAAEAYWWYATSRNVSKLASGSPQEQALMNSVGASLGRAIALLPRSAEVNAEYGHYLWQFVSDKAGGMKYLNNAVALDPTSSTAHAMLGDMYSNPAPGLYSPDKAEAELRKASQLDSHYAYPHFVLAWLNVDRGRFGEAETELQAYIYLLPSVTSQAANIAFLQRRIKDGLARRQ